MENPYGNVQGLSPAFVAGADVGSTYKVVVRTANGYVGVRRLSKYLYRVRCERFDRAPMFTINDAKSIGQLSAMGLNVVDEGRRVSGTFAHAGHAVSVAGTLCSVLLEVEKELSTMESCNDDQAMAADEKIEAAFAEKQKAKNKANVPEVKEEVKEEKKEAAPKVNGKKPKGLN